MYDLINDLIVFFGINEMPTNFGYFLSWFVMFLIGVELVLFVLDSVFYFIRQVNKGVR